MRKEISGYEGKYSIGEDGVVWNNISDREVTQVLAGIPQYLYVNLTYHAKGIKKKLMRVHRLVALTYIPNPDNLPMVDHKDRDKFNNHRSNLRWACRGINSRNTSITVFILYKGEKRKLIEVIEEYYGVAKNKIMAEYAFCMQNKEGVETFEELLELRASRKREREELKELKEHLESKGTTIWQYRVRLSKGWPEWNAMYGVNISYPFGIIDGGEACKVWYPTKKYYIKHRPKVDQGKLYFYKGENKSLAEWCRGLDLKLQTVQDRVQGKKWSIEKALETPLMKTRKHIINGELKTQRGWSLHFGLDPIKFNSYKFHYKTSFQETLEGMGVDTSGLKIQNY
jgi:hypothetical protein